MRLKQRNKLNAKKSFMLACTFWLIGLEENSKEKVEEKLRGAFTMLILIETFEAISLNPSNELFFCCSFQAYHEKEQLRL